MKKTILLKSALLLCALVAGSSSVWADKTAGFTLKSTTTAPIAAGANPATTTISGSASETWNVGIEGLSYSSMAGLTTSRYWQMGKKNSAITSATFSTSGIPGIIKSIVVKCAAASGPGGSLSATVGGKAFGTQNQSMPTWSSNAGDDVTFSGTASGEIVITETPVASKACYIQSITVTYDDTKYAITPGYAKITYVAPNKLDFSSVDGLKAYVATAASASDVTMTSVGAVPANTPLLLIGTKDVTYNVPVAASATAPETNLLVKGDGTTEFDGTTYDYILYSDGKFYQIGSGTVATNKAYLHLDSAPGARALDIVFDDEPTAIETVKAEKANNEYFNLAGQRVAQPTKGLYIVNGRKVVMK